MKKIFIICMLLCSIVTYSQESKSLEETVKPYVEKLLNSIEQGAEMAMEEIPIILKQYVMFEALISWFMILIGFIVLFIGFKIAKKSIKENWLNDGYFLASMSYILSVSLWCLIFFSYIFTAIKATFFPKLFIVESFLNHI